MVLQVVLGLGKARRRDSGNDFQVGDTTMEELWS